MTHSHPLLRGNAFFSCLPLSDMGTASTAAAKCLDSLYPYKILHLVRHGHGFHNLEGEKCHEALLSYDLLDAKLSPKGWQQVDNLRKQVQQSGLTKRIDLVITSPLQRTMQTAVGVFGCKNQKTGSGIEHPPLMKITNENNRNNNHDESETSTPNCPPIIAVELCRERLGLNPCDKRKNIREYQPLFPTVDFSLIESEEDNLWKADFRETNEEVADRGMKFLKWLWTRQEKEIAVVSHGIFLQQTLCALLDAHPSVNSNDLCSRFRNCELRSVMIVDRSTKGTCLHLPSNVARDSNTPVEEIPN